MFGRPAVVVVECRPPTLEKWGRGLDARQKCPILPLWVQSLHRISCSANRTRPFWSPIGTKPDRRDRRPSFACCQCPVTTPVGYRQVITQPSRITIVLCSSAPRPSPRRLPAPSPRRRFRAASAASTRPVAR